MHFRRLPRLWALVVAATVAFAAGCEEGDEPADPAAPAPAPAPAPAVSSGEQPGGTSGGGSSGTGEVPTVAPPQLDVTGVTPAEGSLSGGTTITITGAGFDASTTAKVGTAACASTTFVDATTLTCVTPALAVATYSVTVTRGSDTKEKSNAYSAKTNALISGSPGTLSLGTLATNWGYSSNTITLTNTGQLTATSLAGAAPAAPFGYVGSSNTYPGYYYLPAESCSSTLAPGATCKLNPMFSPTAPGFDQKTLTVSYHNGATVATTSVLLEGTGATPGTAVSYFDTDGEVVHEPTASATYIEPFEAVFDSSFNLIVSGYEEDSASKPRVAVRRYDLTGVPDAAFGTAGKALFRPGTCDKARGRGKIRLVTDGKLLVPFQCDNSSVSGVSALGILRLNANGTIDTSYGSSGYFMIGSALDASNGSGQVAAIANADGTAILVGYRGGSTADVVKVTTAGALDTSFDTDGVRSFALMAQPLKVAVGNDGAVFIAYEMGTDVHVTKLTASGALASGFGTGNTKTLNIDGSDYVGDLTVRTDGNLVVTTGSGANKIGVAVLSPTTGNNVAAFNGGAVKLTQPLPTSNILRTVTSMISTTADTPIVVGGYEYDTSTGHVLGFVLRMSATGTVDTSFSGDGYLSFQFYGSNNSTLNGLAHGGIGAYALVGSDGAGSWVVRQIWH